jgi:hypothetical protein
MAYYRAVIRASFVAVLSLGLLGGCGQAKRLARTLLDSRIKGPPHERLKWKAKDFFTDAGVISLCRAIEAKNIAEIDRLAKSGVNVNAKGRNNMTPLLWAFPMGEPVFKKMLELGADPNVKLTGSVWSIGLNEGNSVMSASANALLIDGAVHGQYFYDAPMDNYLKLVLEHGGNPNIEDANGETPLFEVKFSYPPSKLPGRLRLLLDAGADINHRNSQGKTPVISAAVGRQDYVLCLLKAGADYRIADDKGSDMALWVESHWRSLHRQLQERPMDQISKLEIAAIQPVRDWLANEGVNWGAARAALESPEVMRNLQSLPADYKHRPWLPQRPTLNKP